ncbi:hypothetical protein FACS189429_1340 [Bacteroidia bacterium]|nr:hypothetical protein FACS189429_1340 [Bacteroidia bacterium]GHV46130.1 hypothetical protein FACS1894180_8980 [Bacteroidia bacterium]
MIIFLKESKTADTNNVRIDENEEFEIEMETPILDTLTIDCK